MNSKVLDYINEHINRNVLWNFPKIYLEDDNDNDDKDDYDSYEDDEEVDLTEADTIAILDLNLNQYDRQSMFRSACMHNRLDLAELIISKVEIDVQDILDSCIFQFICRDYQDVFNFLIKNGANPALKIDEYIRACCNNRNVTLDDLKQYLQLVDKTNLKMSEEEIIQMIDSHTNIEIMDYFFENGVIITEEMIIRALGANYSSMIECAINRGYDANKIVQALAGQINIHVNIETIRILARNGADFQKAFQ